MLALLLVGAGKLVFIQGVQADALTAQADTQREQTTVLAATRGAISDRNGQQLAFTIEGRALAARPGLFLNDPAGPSTVTAYDNTDVPARTADQKRALVAQAVVDVLGSAVNKNTILSQLSDTSKAYVYLAHDILPGQADAIEQKVGSILSYGVSGKLHEIDAIDASTREDIRQDPNDTLAASIVGTTGVAQNGLSGVESKYNALLAGKDGSVTQQVSGGRVIPGSVTENTAAVDGSDVTLTLDSSLQYSLEQSLVEQVTDSGAKGGCAIIEGISDGQIYGMGCYQPGKTALQIGDPALLTPFEPGSVNKVVTFAAALDAGLINADTVIPAVPDSIVVNGVRVGDAWSHDKVDMTATGVLAKSSNVGTLMIAQQVGQDAFAAELAKFGLGQKTGVGLPESAGSYPPLSQWSGASFANLPIGQGISMTMVQLVGMYQAIGNGGVRVQPSIVKGTTGGGVYQPSAAPAATAVMKPTSAQTLLDMLRGTVQGGDFYHDGTGPAAAISGYQVAGKTGTAQQIDPNTHAYSDTLHTLTFAGIVPADAPKFAIAVMLDAPQTASAEGGDDAAPLFHEIASYVLRQEDVPPSSSPAPVYDLYVVPGGD